MAMRHANTVMTIFGLTSVISSGRAYTRAPIFLAIEIAYFAFARLSWNKQFIKSDQTTHKTFTQFTCSLYEMLTAYVTFMTALRHWIEFCTGRSTLSHVRLSFWPLLHINLKSNFIKFPQKQLIKKYTQTFRSKRFSTKYEILNKMKE